MLFIQLTGLSGSGKTTIATRVCELMKTHWPVEVLDGDVYRKVLSPELGFSREDRILNIKRLGVVAELLVKHKVIAIIAAINPFEETRLELTGKYQALTVYIKCDLPVLLKRDTKGLYRLAGLPDGHPDKIANLSGINDPYEPPFHPDLSIDTSTETIEKSVNSLYQFILNEMEKSSVSRRSPFPEYN